MKSSFMFLIALWASMICLSTGVQAQIEPDGVEAMKNLISTYQGISSYSDKTLVIVSTELPENKGWMSRNLNAIVAYQKGQGLRIEGTRKDYDYFIARSDGEQVNIHWLKQADVDSRVPLRENEDFLSRNLPTLPFAFSDIGFLTGSVTIEKLKQLPISRLSLGRNALLAPSTGPQIRCDVLKLDYTNSDQKAVKLALHIGQKDGVIYMAKQEILGLSPRTEVTLLHSDIAAGDSFPKEYWTLDCPLMGAAATVTAPSPPSIPGIVNTLPTLTAQDVYGKTFTVSPEDKKNTLIYFFTPGDAKYVIEDIQQFAIEGELRNLQVVGIVRNLSTPSERTIPALRAFLDQHKVTFPVYTDEGDTASLNSLQRQLGAKSPGVLIYGADGQLKADTSIVTPRDIRAVLNSIAPIPLH